MTSGEAAFVLPECDDLAFLMIEAGDVFGITDLVPQAKQAILTKEQRRAFSVLTLDYCEVLCISLEVRNLKLKAY